jgi:hypothetical protein
MFGRTFRIALLLIATQLSSGCFCCCERPLFWRKYQGGNCCCEPCTTCCGAPPVSCCGAAPPHGMPVYTGAPVALPAAPMGPVVNPQLDRMQPISSTALNGSR